MYVDTKSAQVVAQIADDIVCSGAGNWKRLRSRVKLVFWHHALSQTPGALLTILSLHAFLEAISRPIVKIRGHEHESCIFVLVYTVVSSDECSVDTGDGKAHAHGIG